MVANGSLGNDAPTVGGLGTSAGCFVCGTVKVKFAALLVADDVVVLPTSIPLHINGTTSNPSMT